MKFLAAAISLAVALSASAQSLTYKLSGAEKADADAVALLQSNLPISKKGSVEIIIGEAGDKAVKHYADRIPQAAEGYYLSVGPKKVIIAGRDNVGTFYGVQQFLKNPAQPIDTASAPVIPLRGVIEGFYGNPWSFNDRKNQFDFYGKHGMNVYVYGPKDDPYHHSRWYEPYPADKAAEMAELVKHAAKNKVKFTWAMHPSNSIESSADRQKALDKFAQMYDLGVRSFAVFFDDISAKSVDTQIDYLNFLDREFVKKHTDVEPLIVCPTVYNKSWASGNYLKKMGTQLNDDIAIMWTGNSVCDMIDAADCEWFTNETTRKPFIWLNYPVNDYGMHNLLMGPVIGNDPAIYNMVTAFCSNPMQYAEASKVALYGLADFAWNPEAYNADESWENALHELMPDHVEAFRIFCENNVDVGESVHGLRFGGETPEFVAVNTQYADLGNPDAVEAYREYFRSRLAAANELLAAAEGNALLTEIKEWLIALRLQAEQGLALTDMAAALDADLAPAFIDAYRRYTAANTKAENNISRNFPGSIQSVRVQTATRHVAPWLKLQVASLIDAFKASGAEYPQDLFPKQLIENGTYYILFNGLILGNPQAGSVGGNPVFQADIDEINPNRQEWHIKMEPVRGRYDIHNSKDERYVNELANFGVNPYSPDWNTYIITRGENGKYAIQNAGNAGRKFWSVSGDRIITNSPAPQYIFDITTELPQ
ncbi:MAG: beta-N-acetylglucosaminidase domain-containing protein [Bacteroides sp.]|nr:beta-N-acetylglucosaminidase domain-containing protein [Bacteroides sp.]MCM1379205.1 beta-N-acetylglucosaminidase domain-containing protein [Bacteroides sp.]MCM1445146.1 beta-N-acetylglucosaminidase domain-containing protein [Prevotella sp.]